MSSFICPLCSAERDFDCFAKMFRHVTIYHQNDPNFSINCDLHQTCGVLYRTFAAYKSHIYRRHSAELYSTKKNNNNNDTNIILINNQQHENTGSSVDLDIINPDDNTNENDNSNFLYDEAELEFEMDEYQTTSLAFTSHIKSINSDDSDAGSVHDIKRSYISFILNLREQLLLPKNITNMISSYIISLIERIQILSEKNSYFTYTDSGQTPTTSFQTQRTKVIECEQLKNLLNSICESIDSISRNEYQLIKTCQDYFGYTSPEEIILSSASEDIERAYFIPLEKSLPLMLKSKPFVSEILREVQRQRVATETDQDLMYSIRDAYHGNKLDEEALLIQLYLDDISMTNPIGAKRDNHKMSMIYYTLEDIPHQYKSKLDFIYLIGICESYILKDNIKAKRFLQPIIDNLNQLQFNGLVIKNDHFKFSVSTIVADNLAAHLVGGFQSCFSNGYFCRRCYIKYDDRNLPIPLSEINTRMMNDHDDLVHELFQNPGKAPLMGVVGPGLFDNLIGFHPTTSLPSDCMHDMIEGVCPMVIMSLLKQASSMRLITYAGIEKRMDNFNYGYFDKSNRPPPIQVKHLQNDRIVATASQKLCMFKVFPIIFYDIIHRLPAFIVYKVLREILDLVLSYPFRKQWLPVVGDLCESFHLKMLTYFPDKMIPKVHFVREYQKIIHDYGPPIKNWCFRYESSHSYYKKIMMRTSNFKNVPKTLATRYCLKQSFKSDYLYQLNDLIYPIGIKKSRTTCFNMAIKKLLVNDLGWNGDDEHVILCVRLVCDTIEYSRSAVYVVDLLHLNEQPIFAQIVFIIKVNEKWWLLVDLLNTVAYNEDLFAWEIKSIDHYAIIDPCQLKYYYKEYDIDGKTLEMMSTVERISVVIPKFKQQLIFLEEREKLFKKLNDYPIEFSNSSFIIPTNSQSSSIAPPNSQSSSIVSSDSQALPLEARSTLDVLPKSSINQPSSEPSVIEEKTCESFPHDYVIPTLPNVLLNDVVKGDLKNFGPHCANRQILIDAIAYDLIDKFNLFYPSHTQFDNIGAAIVKFLKLPVTKENITIWKDALQTKLKRKRSENRDNAVVQEYQIKYSKTGSGRPVKRQLGETAQRDRYKQMVLLSFDNELSNEIQTKSEHLRDSTGIDINTQLELWKETLSYRRKFVRDGSTTDIIKHFPGYSNAVLVFEEVKMLTKIDLSAAIRRQVPVLLDKIVKTPMFVTDSLPIQLLKILCRQFDETIQHLFTDTEPFTAYPTLVCLNDLIHVYVDFNLIVSTNSPDDALALLIAMYTIFELSFNKKSRTIRFLYSVLHGDKRFLSNSIRMFIKENNINIYCEQQQSSSAASNAPSAISTTVANESQSDSQVTEQCGRLDGHDISIDNQETKENDQIDIVDSSSKPSINTNECSNLVKVASLSDFDSQQHTTKQRKGRKRNRNIDIDDDPCSTDAVQSQHQLESQKHKPLADITNSSSTSRQIKRKRRI